MRINLSQTCRDRHAFTVLLHTNRNSDKGVEITFLGTRTGLTRTNLFIPADQLSNQWVLLLDAPLIITYSARWLCLMNGILHSSPQLYSLCLRRDFLTAEDKEGVFNADHFPLWYKRAAEQVPGTFVYSIPFSTGALRRAFVPSIWWVDCKI